MYKPNEINFPKLPGNRVAKPATDGDRVKYNKGFTNPDLFRILDIHPVEFKDPEKDPVEFDPYQNHPQSEFNPREYTFHISGGNSYRLVDIKDHDEESTFWEIP